MGAVVAKVAKTTAKILKAVAKNPMTHVGATAGIMYGANEIGDSKAAADTAAAEAATAEAAAQQQLGTSNYTFRAPGQSGSSIKTSVPGGMQPGYYTGAGYTKKRFNRKIENHRGGGYSQKLHKLSLHSVPKSFAQKAYINYSQKIQNLFAYNGPCKETNWRNYEESSESSESDEDW